MTDARISFHLSAAERAVVDAIAEQNGTSVNFVVRYAVRQLIGMNVPRDLEIPELHEVLKEFA